MTQLYTSPRTLGRGRTRELWKHFKQAEIFENSDHGFYFRDTFMPYVSAYYTLTSLNGGTHATVATSEPGGAIRLDPGSTTDDDGAQIQLGTPTNPSVLPGASTEIFFEALFRLTTISTMPRVFLGLSTANEACIADSDGGLAATSMLGFHIGASDGEMDLIGRVADATVATKTNLLDFTDLDGDWVKAGFYVRNTGLVIPYVNGIKKAPSYFLSSGDFPTSIMTPTFAVVGQGTVRPTLDLKEWSIGVNNSAAVLAA